MNRAMLARWRRWSSEPPHVLDIAPLPWMNGIRPFETDVGRLIVAVRQAYDLMTYAAEKKNPTQLQTNGGSTAIRFTPVTQEKDKT